MEHRRHTNTPSMTSIMWNHHRQNLSPDKFAKSKQVFIKVKQHEITSLSHQPIIEKATVHPPPPPPSKIPEPEPRPEPAAKLVNSVETKSSRPRPRPRPRINEIKS